MQGRQYPWIPLLQTQPSVAIVFFPSGTCLGPGVWGQGQTTQNEIKRNLSRSAFEVSWGKYQEQAQNLINKRMENFCKGRGMKTEHSGRIKWWSVSMDMLGWRVAELSSLPWVFLWRWVNEDRTFWKKLFDTRQNLSDCFWTGRYHICPDFQSSKKTGNQLLLLCGFYFLYQSWHSSALPDYKSHYGTSFFVLSWSPSASPFSLFIF